MEFGTEDSCFKNFMPALCWRASSIGGMIHRRRQQSADGVLRKARMLLVLRLGLLVAACGPEDFLNPPYTKKDLVFDPLLPGLWEQKGDSGTLLLEFKPTEGRCYVLSVKPVPNDAGDPADEDEQPFNKKFDACLVGLGRTLFLDVQARELLVKTETEVFHLNLNRYSSNENPFTPAIFHTPEGLFVTLAPARGTDGTTEESSKYQLQLSPPHWFFRIWINHATLRLSDFEPSGDAATLSTEDLQRLALQSADDPQTFSDDGEWQRKDGGVR